MSDLLRERFFVVWVVLIAVTLVSAKIGGASGLAGTSSGAAVTMAVLAIAFVKVAAVMFTYMDVGRAPLALKIVTCAWLAVVLTALIAVYKGVF